MAADKLFVYGLAWNSKGVYYHTIKNLFKKYTIELGFIPSIIVPDPNEDLLLLVNENSPSILLFFAFPLTSEEVVKIGEPKFSIDVQFQVQRGFFNVSHFIKGSRFKNVLCIQTAKNFQIFRQDEINKFRSAFSFAKVFSPSQTTFFRLVSDYKSIYNIKETPIKNVLGCFYFLQDEHFEIYFISNLLLNRQTMIDENYSIEFDGFENCKLVDLQITHKDLGLVTLSKDSVLILTSLQPRNEVHRAHTTSIKLLKQEILFLQTGFNYFFENIFVSLPPSQLVPELLAYYKYNYLLYSLNGIKIDLTDSYITLISNETCLVFSPPTGKVTLAKLQQQEDQTNYNLFALQDCETDLFKLHPKVNDIKFFPLSKKKILVIVDCDTAFAIYEIFIPFDDKIETFKLLTEIQKSVLGDPVYDFGPIYSLETYLTYKLFFLTGNRTLISSWKIEEKNCYKNNELNFDAPIIRFSANKKYPYYLVGISAGLELLFISSRLELLCRFSLSTIDPELAQHCWITHVSLLRRQNTELPLIDELNKVLVEPVNPSTSPVKTKSSDSIQYNKKVLYNFSITYLYDNIYFICYNSKQMLFELTSRDNRFVFIKVDLGEFRLFDLHEHTKKENEVLRIVNINSRNVCYTRGNMMNFVSAKIEPNTPRAQRSKFAAFNFHKYLLLTRYNYQFFTFDVLFELLKLKKAGTIYQLLYDTVKPPADGDIRKSLLMESTTDLFAKTLKVPVLEPLTQVRRSSFFFDALAPNPNQEGEINRYSFNPMLMEKYLQLTIPQFLENNNLESEAEFFSITTNLLEKDQEISSRRKATARLMIEVLMKIKEVDTKIDFPARLFYIEFNKRLINSNLEIKGDKAQYDETLSYLTSKLVFLAAITEEQDFILTLLLNKRPITLELMRTYCLSYWIKETEKLKQILDKATLLEYKEKKSAMSVILWYVILGKVRLLPALFKVEPDQQKFVGFFARDFTKEENIEKAISNAFTLKSQKKFELSAAFFLLAKQYEEAIEIITEHLKNINVMVLVLRIYEKEIPAELAKKCYKRFIEDFGIKCGDILTLCLGKLFNKEYGEILNSINEYLEKPEVVQHDTQVEQQLGFNFSDVNSSLFDLLNYLINSSNFKRYLPEQFKIVDHKRVLETFYINYTKNDKVYLSFIVLLEIKIYYPSEYNLFFKKYQRTIEQMIMKVSYKKLADLIMKNKISHMVASLENFKVFSTFFGLESERMLTKLVQRINLLDDVALNHYAMALTDTKRLEAEIKTEKFSRLCLHECIQILKRDSLAFYSGKKWLTDINLVCSGAEIAQDIVLNGNDVSQRMVTIISFLTFLLLIKASCYEEALSLIEHSQALRAQNNAFLSFVMNVKNKAKNRLALSSSLLLTKENGEPVRNNYSPTNTMLTLFFKYIFLNNFLTADAYDEMVKSRVTELEPNFPLFIEIYKENLKSSFFNLLQTLSIETQFEFIKEVQILLFEKVPALRKKSFNNFDPNEVLFIEENGQLVSEAISCVYYSRSLDEYRLAKLLGTPQRTLTDQLKLNRRSLLGPGIELARFKMESIQLARARVAAPCPPAIHLYLQNKLRRISLFESLMKRPRIKDGMLLASDEDPHSMTTTLESSELINVNELREKPLILRILYRFFFDKEINLVTPHKLRRILESIIDNQPHTLRPLNLITDMKTTTALPLIFAPQGNQLMVLNPKSTATLLEFKVGQFPIKSLELDRFGQKLLVIDNKKVANIVSYQVSLNTMEIIKTFDGNYYHGTFTHDTCTLALTTPTTKVVLYDALLDHEQVIDLEDHQYERCKILYSNSMKKYVLINKKKCLIHLLDQNDLKKDSTISLHHSEKVRAYVLDDPLKTLVVGLKSGLVISVDLENGTVIEEKLFMENEHKAGRIDSMIIIQGFVIVAGGNGTVSLLMKL